MKKGKKGVVKDTSERWLLTYADLMNLLLILFIILYTMSKVDTGKYKEVSESLRSAMGVSPSPSFFSTGGSGTSPLEVGSGSSDSSDGQGTGGLTESQQMESVLKKVSTLIDEQNLKGSVDVSVQERGIQISITAQLLFKSGSAEIEPSAVPTIREIGKVLLAIPNKTVRIEGHTDNDPISTSRFPDNQELSSARANNVLRFMAKEVGLDPSILSATGYGENRPKVPNSSEENKSMNRRVDIVILNSSFEKSEPGRQ